MRETLDGKLAWVSGAGSGIGQDGAVKLAAAGAATVLTGRREAPLRETAGHIEAAGGTAIVEPGDIADAAAMQAIVDRIDARFGRLDILVNNAGLNLNDRRFSQLTPESWAHVIETDLNGPFYCTAAALPIMRRQKDGLIINVSSWAGRFPSFVAGPVYSAAKHAMVSMNASLNMEEFVNGIRATVICPAEVATPILDRRPVPVDAEKRARMLQSDDLGETILFVAQMPKHVCLNEILISPSWNRAYMNSPDQKVM